jgi:hypothetical protein
LVTAAAGAREKAPVIVLGFAILWGYVKFFTGKHKKFKFFCKIL